LLDDYSIVLEALTNYGSHLDIVSDRLKKDMRIVSAAVSSSGMAL
jgi:hypothetical protein